MYNLSQSIIYTTYNLSQSIIYTMYNLSQSIIYAMYNLFQSILYTQRVYNSLFIIGDFHSSSKSEVSSSESLLDS